MDIDLRQIVSRCQWIENKLEELESQFHPDVIIVAQNLPGEMESVDVILRKAEHLVDDELYLADVKVVRAKRLLSRNGKSGIVNI